MQRRWIGLCALGLVWGSGLGGELAWAAAPQNPIPKIPAEIAVDDPPIFPLSKVERGLTGYGYTVFASADGPQRFEFEVLGVMRSYLGPGEDLIIAQLRGERIERTGVIAGMSGSPVYVDGNLVGAVGYRFGSFTKDPIAGITPIERMLTAKDEAPKVARSPATGSRTKTTTASVTSGPMTSGPMTSGTMTAWGRAEPIAVPIAVSGIHPTVLDAFAPYLDRAGLGPRVAAGGGGGRATDKPRPFYASGPIAGTLVDGDIAMSGIGTVTWVKGKRFLAFGHPFQGTGRSVMPVSNAEILTTVAAQSSSWKLGQATVPVGGLTDDRLHAIAGTMGDFPQTVKVTYKLDLDGPRVKTEPLREVKLKVIRDGSESVLYVAIGLANTLLNRVGAERGGTVDLVGTAKLSTGDVIELRDRAALDGSSGVFIQVAIGLLGELGPLLDNGFVDVELEEVTLSIRHREEVASASLVSIRALSPLVTGKTAVVALGLRPHEGAQEELRVEIAVPEGLQEGPWKLVAADPRGAWRQLNAGGHVPHATDWASLLEARSTQPTPGTISLFLVSEAEGLRLDGRGLPTLPGSLSGLLMGGGGLQGKAIEARVLRVGSATQRRLISGKQSAKVWVRSASRGEP